MPELPEVEPIRGRERSVAEREPTGEILSAKHEGSLIS
jgi:hypothetical protein